MTPYLDPDQLLELRTTAVEQFENQQTMRPLLFEHVNRQYAAALPVIAAPATQLHSDLTRMNQVERLIDGTVPLEIWLQNAVALTLEQGPRAVLERALDAVAAQASGEPDVGPAADVSEIKEAIVFRDDTLEIGFLATGAAAAAAVGRILVQPYENGAVRIRNGAPESPHSGTCWLISDHHLVTNHHVVNARSAIDGPAPHASEADLRQQAATAVIRFGFDTDDAVGTEVTGAGLVAWDADLDYAVLETADALPHRPLPLLRAPLSVTPEDNVAVNVIQHPGGGPKRIGLRNNIVHDSTERDIRYFTDTRRGSSGAPVLTDAWTVCGVHRSSKQVDVQFQGKPVAHVNVGTQVSAILADLSTRFPTVYNALPT